jgi:ribosome-associated protein
MAKKKITTADAAILGIQEKKGKQIVKLNLESIEQSVSNSFIICHGTSKPHVDAIAESVQECVKKETGYNPVHKEGFKNAEWILIDYFDVVVHIFQEPTRRFYKLEDLWADAEIQYIGNND